VNGAPRLGPWSLGLLLGVSLGVAYTLSPLTVWFAAGMVVFWRAARRGLSDRERFWLGGLLAVAIGARVLAVAGLFLSADPARPYAVYFGDEELFKNESIWIRNIGLGVPISAADFVYAFDDVGQAGYIGMWAYLQAIVGEAPYGMHLLNIAGYVVAITALYRMARSRLGGVSAMAGLAVMLFLPSLLVWSTSALKEPAYLVVAVAELGCALAVARAPEAWQRLAAGVGVVVLAFALQGLRNGGLVVVAVGAVGGLAAGISLTRPRWLLALAVVVPVVATVALAQPAIQARTLQALRTGAFNHAGYALTPGNSYRVLDERYYLNRYALSDLPAPEAARFALAATVSYFTEPLPWRVESRTMMGYLPEYVVWWLIVLLAPVGLVAGLRRDAIFTSLLAFHAMAAIFTVALNSGNIGTLIRHRGLALPYLVWLAALGGCALLRRMAGTASSQG